MKKLCMAAVLLVLAACQPTERDDSMTSYSRRTFDSLDHVGNLILKEVKVTGELNGSGDLKAEKTHMGSIEWKGPAELQQCSILDSASFIGPLKADQTAFAGPLTIKGNSVEMTGTEVSGNLDIEAANQGQSTFNQITVKDGVTGTGTLSLTKGRLGGIEWEGPVTITECHIRGDAEFTGTVSLDKVTSAGNITATSAMIELNAVEIDGNLLIPQVGKNAEQKVSLKGGSVIKGNVTFASGMGVVEKENGSKIEGRVIGTK